MGVLERLRRRDTRKPVDDAANKNDPKTTKKEEGEDEDPRDKGWAWVIAFSTAFMNFVLSGSIKANGFFYLGWLDLYKESPSTIAWIRTSYGLVQTFLAPLAGYLKDRMSFRASRILVFTTGFLLALSTVVTAWMPNVLTVFITHSLIGGVTTGLVITPVLTLLPEYFIKKRGLASGISLAGGSLGGLLLPIFINLMLEDYGMRGMLTIVGGLFFNIMVVAATMIPLKKTKKAKAESPIEMKNVKTLQLEDDGSRVNKGFKVDGEDLSDNKHEEAGSHFNGGFVEDGEDPCETIQGGNGSKHKFPEDNNTDDGSVAEKNSESIADDGSDVDSGLNSEENENHTADGKEHAGENDQSQWNSDETSGAEESVDDEGREELTWRDEHIDDDHTTQSESNTADKVESKSSQVISNDKTDESCNQNASNNNENESTDQENNNEDSCSTKKKTIGYRFRHNNVIKGLKVYLDFLRTPHLISLILTLLCQSCAYFTQFFVLVPFTTELGESTTIASTVLAIISVVELFARFLTGYIGDKLKKNKFLILFVSFPVSFVIGIILVAFPSKTLLYVYAPIFGLFGGQATTLCIPLTTELVPPKDIGKAAGIFPIVVGIGSAVGNQVATTVFEKTNSYKYSQLFCVCMYLAALFFLCFHGFGIWRSRRSKKMIDVIV